MNKVEQNLVATLTMSLKRASAIEASAAMSAKRSAELEVEARKEREDLERALKLARGTGDVREQAAAAVAMVKGNGKGKVTLQTQIEQALRGEHAPMSMTALAKEIGVGVGKVAACMRELKRKGCVYNLGTEDHPCWIWVVGDKTATRELNDHVARLITYTPMTFAQLLAATGARRGRVSGALVEVQKTRSDWKNLGDDRTYRWFLPPVKRGRK